MASSAVGIAGKANPIGALIGAGFDVLNLGMHLLAAHDQRIQIAREENAAVQQAVTTLDADLQTIFKAANAGDITPAAAAAACADVSQWYWNFLNPMIQGPTKGPTKPFPGAGVPDYYAAGSGAACHCAGEKIGNVVGCTAGCCIGCAAVDPTLSAAYHIFVNGGGSFAVAPIVANKYGLQTRVPYTLSYKKPAKIIPEELTLNAKTGVVSVGAPPSASDVVIQAGAQSTQASPDQGGVTQVTPATTIPGTGVGAASTAGALSGISSQTLLIGVGVMAFVLLLSLTNRPREAY